MSTSSAAAADDAWTPRAFRVTQVTRELSDTVTLALTPVAGAPAPFQPGQFNMLYAFGVGEIAVSLSAEYGASGAILHTVRAVGAVSEAIAARRCGELLGVRGPFGSAWPLAAAEGRDMVIVAGGLGLAPLRPAIQYVLGHRSRYGRVIILAGMRRPSEILYREELERWADRGDIRLQITVDRAEDGWQGKVGVVPALIGRGDRLAADTTALVCGPEVMMRFAANALLQAGVAAANIHLSMERNMKCAIGLCGHCQFGPTFVCRDGPVMPLARIAELLTQAEI